MTKPNHCWRNHKGLWKVQLLCHIDHQIWNHWGFCWDWELSLMAIAECLRDLCMIVSCTFVCLKDCNLTLLKWQKFRALDIEKTSLTPKLCNTPSMQSISYRRKNKKKENADLCTVGFLSGQQHHGRRRGCGCRGNRKDRWQSRRYF